ncbi:response regulator [Paenibacillus sp. NPDC056579]|uniref:response regulator transcription factor n=1 Tax=Paenibacillus sp. NPDC056579 TaxID=3345871 RepID=UPI0036C0AA71
MYNILIVDDEKIEREGIKLLIRQYGLPFHTAEAENGLKALDYLRTHPVDLLLTDIKMPFMDGMTLAGEARKLDSALQIIFLSAFGEFHYAKRAMQLQAADYILKPVEIQEFLQVMQAGIGRCEERRRHYLLELLHGGPLLTRSMMNVPAVGTVRKGFPYTRLLLLESRTKCFDSRNDDAEHIVKQAVSLSCDYINLNEYQSLLLFHNELHEGTSMERLTVLGQRLQDELRELLHTEFDVVFSSGRLSEQGFQTECNEMEKLLEAKFFSEKPLVLCTESPGAERSGPTDGVDALVERIQAALEQKEAGRSREELERLFDILDNSTSYSTIYVKYVATVLVKHMVTHLPGYAKESVQEVAQNIHHCHNLAELKELLARFLEHGAVTDSPGDPNINRSGRKDVALVLDFIHQHYRHDISLEHIAEKVYLSPSYLSYLFKKETGLSLVKYVTQYRMEKAKHYLRSTNMKIVDIGHEVGYANVSYFGSLFKNYAGMSPAQYREESL